MRRDYANEKYINQIAQRVANIKKPVADYYAMQHAELKMFENLQGVQYLPTPFEIADYYNIDYEFVRLEGNMPSYLSEGGLGTIFISNAYCKESYKARILCAHELGHYFLHDTYAEGAAMNIDYLNEYLPLETQKEYEANVFAILLMPQIMAGYPWKEYAPRILNRKVYKKVLEQDGG